VQEKYNKITIPKKNCFKNHGSAKDINKNFDFNRNKLENKVIDRKEDEFNSSFGSNSTNNLEEECNININKTTTRTKSDKFQRRFTERKNSTNIVKLLPCYQQISPPKERKTTSDNGTIIILKNMQNC